MKDREFITKTTADVEDKIKKAGVLSLNDLLNSESPWMTLELLKEVQFRGFFAYGVGG
jgi:hypothetical protein